VSGAVEVGHPRRILVAAALGAALNPLNSTMVAVALPALSVEFAAEPASVTVAVVTGYLIATLVCQMPAGSIADRVGYGKALSAGRWIFAGGAVLGTFASTLNAVVAGRLLMAAGGSLMVPTAMALIRVAVPTERRPRAFGTMGAVMGGAAAIGPALGAWIVAELGWRSLFLINLPILAASWVLGRADLKVRPYDTVRNEPPIPSDVRRGGPSGPPEGPPDGAMPPERIPFDWLGSALLGVVLVLLTFATLATGSVALLMLAAGLMLFAVLVAHERRVTAPVLDFSLFARRGFTAGAGVIAAQNLAMYSLLIQIPFLFAPGTSGSHLGLAIIAMTATMALTSPFGGWLSERVGAKPVVVVGGITGAAGVVLLGRLAPSAPVVDIAGRLLLAGLGLGLSTGPAQATALAGVPSHQSGLASATVSMFRYLGGIGGTVVLGMAFAAGGDGGAAHHTALWIFAGAFLVSAALGLAFPRTGPRE